jgi:hypothetical protein
MTPLTFRRSKDSLTLTFHLNQLDDQTQHPYQTMKLNSLLLLALFPLVVEGRDNARALGGLRRVLEAKTSSTDAPLDMEKDDLVEPIADSTDTGMSMAMSMNSSKAGKKFGGSAKKGKKVKSVHSKRGPKLEKSTKASAVINGDSEDFLS